MKTSTPFMTTRLCSPLTGTHWLTAHVRMGESATCMPRWPHWAWTCQGKFSCRRGYPATTSRMAWSVSSAALNRHRKRRSLQVPRVAIRTRRQTTSSGTLTPTFPMASSPGGWKQVPVWPIAASWRTAPKPRIPTVPSSRFLGLVSSVSTVSTDARPPRPTRPAET